MVVLGVVLDFVIGYLFPAFDLRSVKDHHVSLPVFGSVHEFTSGLVFPDIAKLVHPTVIATAFIIAVVASIESLLSIEAADKLDPYRRITSTNRELMAQGVGNICSGLVGGLPVTAVIVRSSTNIYAGAKTKSSAIFHGAFLTLSALFFPALLNLIPLSCLAAVLIMVGYKLVSPKVIKEMYKSGPDQFLPFIITLAAILFTDLLTGVLLGLALGLLFVLKTNHHDAISVVNDKNEYLMRLNKDVSFVNKAELKKELRRIPDGATLLIDGTRALFIDKDVYDLLNDFEEQAQHRGITVELKNVRQKSLGFLSSSTN